VVVSLPGVDADQPCSTRSTTCSFDFPLRFGLDGEVGADDLNAFREVGRSAPNLDPHPLTLDAG
jgi:hypothetical protein